MAWTVNIYLCKATSLLPFFRPSPSENTPEISPKERNNRNEKTVKPVNTPLSDLHHGQATPSSGTNERLALSNTPTLEAPQPIYSRSVSNRFSRFDTMDSYDDITRVNSHTITVNHTTKKSIESTSDNEQALSLPATSSISYHEQVAITLQVWIDPFAYSVLGMIGLFVFYLHPFGDVARSLPLFLSINALAFIFSTRMVPDSWKVLLHPILVTSIITCLLVWALGATIGLSINQSESLRKYLVL